MPSTSVCSWLILLDGFVAAEHAGDNPAPLLDIHQPAAVNMVDYESYQQPHEAVVDQAERLVAEYCRYPAEQLVHHPAWRVFRVKGEAGDNHAEIKEEYQEIR